MRAALSRAGGKQRNVLAKLATCRLMDQPKLAIPLPSQPARERVPPKFALDGFAGDTPFPLTSGVNGTVTSPQAKVLAMRLHALDDAKRQCLVREEPSWDRPRSGIARRGRRLR